MIIRSLSPADIDPITRWITQIPLWQNYGLTVEGARKQLNSGLASGVLLLTVDLPGVSACGLAWVVLEGAFARSAYLRWIAVDPAQANRGIGSALLAQVEAAVRPHSRDLFLLAADFNTAAHRFYRRHNYRQVGIIPGYILPDVDELLFWKRLEGSE